MSKNVQIFSETSLKLISKILATMMCFWSGQRSQTLVSLSTDCIYLNNSGCVFYISKILKTSRPTSHQEAIEFKAYPHDVSLCVVALIKLYLDKTAALRHDENSMFLLAMFPHTNQCHQEHWQGGYQIYYTRQVFIPKRLKLILSIQHRHQMRSVVVCSLPKAKRQLDGQI